MQNVVDQLNALKSMLDVELLLRNAARAEFANGIQEGPMKTAHDAAIENVIAAAKALVEKADVVE